MRIRPYLPEWDFPVISKWITDPRTHALWCADLLPYPPEPEAFHKKLHALAVEHGDMPYVAADENGQAIGFFCYAIHPETDTGFFKFVMTDSSRRGQGIGREMMQLAVHYARTVTKAKSVQLCVFSVNEAAKRCYQHAGFRQTGCTEAVFRYADEIWDRCHMEFSEQKPEAAHLLQFLGRGSAFADAQNCAFFSPDAEKLVLLDCPMSAFHRLRQTELITQKKEIIVLVTHPHSDHVGGIPMLIHYAYYVLGIPVTVIAPNEAVLADLQYLIDRMDGCDPKGYHLTADYHAPWLCSAIPTVHAPQLENRCFGWHLKIAGTDVIYTGDTATAEPFLPLLHAGAYFYTEAAYYPSDVHLQIDALLPVIRKLCAAGVHVYLMHLDREAEIAAKIADTGAALAPLF